MVQTFEKNNNATYQGNVVQRTRPIENIPMHPDDFNALLAWIKAKRFHETNFEKSFTERPVYAF
jgi:hypothetical protein